MKKITNESYYYPKTTLDSISAQNQPYPSSKYYPFPEPKNTFRLNPLVLPSLKNLDVDDLQDVFGKGIQESRQSTLAEKIENEKMFKENEEIQEIKASIEYAKLNKTRALQMHQNQMKRMQNLIKDTEEDEEVLKKLKLDKLRAKEEEERKKNERIKAKHLIQQQMLEKEKLKEESKKEYQKDLNDIQNIMDKIRNQDLENLKEDQRKKDITRQYMENAYAEKAEKKRREKEEERLQKEKERQYQQHVSKRENDFNEKKAQIQFEKDKIFEKLCQEEAKRQAERDYWENVRNELHTEQENKKAKLQELAEKEKLQRQKEDIISSAIKQLKLKEENRKKEKDMEEAFKKKLIEKFQEDEQLEKLNLQKRKEKEKELKQEIERQWQLKLEQYQKQKESELNELYKKKKEQERKGYLIEQEKRRLIKENEKLLQNYYPTGYQKALNSLQNLSPPKKEENARHDVIFNNIFGNSNPNKASAYPKYGKIKNFVYDKAIQEVHPNINIVNYPMYNATANNDYDSYPTPEEYKKMMDKTGQLNYAYAGGCNTTGIPMRSQMPIFANKNLNNQKWGIGNFANRTQYGNYIKTEFNSSNKNLNNSNGFKNYSNINIDTNCFEEVSKTGRGFRFNNTENLFYQRQKSVSPFNKNLTMPSTNPNGTHSPENYQQTIKPRLSSKVLA